MMDVSDVKSFYPAAPRQARDVHSAGTVGMRVRNFLWSQMERWRDRRLRRQILVRYGARLLRDMGVVVEDQFGRPCGRDNDDMVLPWHFMRVRRQPRDALWHGSLSDDRDMSRF